jgi:chorismate mutase
MIERLRTPEAAPTDKQLKAQIAQLRAAISHVDAKIIQDIAERMKWVEQIGKLKHKHNIQVLQLGRWESLLKDHIEKAQKIGLDGEFIKAVFELIHTQAVKKQL